MNPDQGGPSLPGRPTPSSMPPPPAHLAADGAYRNAGAALQTELRGDLFLTPVPTVSGYGRDHAVKLGRESRVPRSGAPRLSEGVVFHKWLVREQSLKAEPRGRDSTARAHLVAREAGAHDKSPLL